MPNRKQPRLPPPEATLSELNVIRVAVANSIQFVAGLGVVRIYGHDLAVSFDVAEGDSFIPEASLERCQELCRVRFRRER